MPRKLDIDEVNRIWNKVWADSGVTCRYQPNNATIIEWCFLYPLDLVLESIEDGIPNFIRKLALKEGDTVRAGNAVQHSTSTKRRMNSAGGLLPTAECRKGSRISRQRDGY
jgi:hypothetical protein